MSPGIDIAVDSDAWAALDDVESLLERALAAAAAETGVALAEGSEVSLLLCDDARMRTLNRQWRGIDKPTNVLSFPAVEPSALARTPLLGDIAIAYDTAAREAAAEDKRLADHVSHLAAHGFLHLLGHDHVDPAEAGRMEALETRIMARLGIADPYAGTWLVDEPG